LAILQKEFGSSTIN